MSAPRSWVPPVHSDHLLITGAVVVGARDGGWPVTSPRTGDGGAAVATPLSEPVTPIPQATRSTTQVNSRAKNAAIECCNIVEEGAAGKLELSRFEAKALADAKAALEALTDNSDQFVSDCMDKYKKEVKVFLPENYGL